MKCTGVHRDTLEPCENDAEYTMGGYSVCGRCLACFRKNRIDWTTFEHRDDKYSKEWKEEYDKWLSQTLEWYILRSF